MRINYNGFVFTVERHTSTTSIVSMYKTVTVPKKFLWFKLPDTVTQVFIAADTIQKPIDQLVPLWIQNTMDELITNYNERLAAWKYCTFDIDCSS